MILSTTSLTLINNQQGTRLTVLTCGQRLQGLPIALAQAKVGNKSENLLNRIC